jgi:tRNA A-37 threonylcarbamoyl transferase component Bud32
MNERLVIHSRLARLDGPIASHRLDRPGTVLGWTGGDIVGTREHGDIRRAELEGAGAVYMKRYVYPRPSLRELFTGSVACREWRNSERMRTMGIAQPEILIAATQVGAMGVRGSFIITLEMAGARSLAELLQEREPALSPQDLDRVARALVDLIRTMHAHRFCHWDLKPRNVLVVLGADPPALAPIDSVHGRSLHPFNRRHAEKRDYRFLLEDRTIGPRFRELLASSRAAEGARSGAGDPGGVSASWRAR